MVDDEVGVLEKITSILAKYNISIDNFLQKKNENGVNVLLSTHIAIEKEIKKAICEIEKLPFVNTKICLIRMEG
jgi:homoserine dehydrogenase